MEQVSYQGPCKKLLSIFGSVTNIIGTFSLAHELGSWAAPGSVGTLLR